ncbi:MAG: hypothetical protein BWX92_01668 [Deltaproteobacteria bacterium ADurb.Bin135]|nr:MAG: hypothetical protein BWX92_01668 [Deltaproteobacteria bacterium ADurb.Bin135]
MDEHVKDFITRIEPKDMQVHDNLAVIPLCVNGNGGPSYLTLKEALEKGTLTVKEVSEGGTVPELKVINKGNDAVLLLDGEELSGAKQNRVLNTTVLVAAKSEIIIPVSCTEHGRWSYTTSEFRDSDVIMAYNIKRKKARSVMRNVRESGRYASDQSEVWDDIQAMSGNAKVHSNTGAMKDVFESKEQEFDDYLKSINIIPNQKGMMVMINGILLGFDIISSASAYKVLHPKLLKSVAIEALLDRKKKTIVPLAAIAKGFLENIATCGHTVHKSVGLGFDYRFEGTEKVGSALVHEDKVVHMAFFTLAESEKIGKMSGFRQRRGYRTR